MDWFGWFGPRGQKGEGGESGMTLEIRLFGRFAVCGADGVTMRFPTRKSEALLAYLANRLGEDVSREGVADLLWPRSGPEQARASLRQEMSVLRRVLGPAAAGAVETHGDRIRLAATAADVDVARFRQLCADATFDSTAGLDAAIAALGLSAAPFLDTFRISSQPFSDWIWSVGQALETQALTLGDGALTQALAMEESRRAAEIATHVLRIDGTVEAAHRALVERYLEQDNLTMARRQMRQFQEAMRQHPDGGASAQMLALQARVKGTETPPGAEADPVAAPDAAAALPQRRGMVILAVQADLDIDDPELFEQAVLAFSDAVRRVVEDQGGTPLLMFNGQVLAGFGYPVGHDRDVDRAIAAGLDSVVAVQDLPEGVTCRVGVAQGVVLVSPAPAGDAAFAVSGAVVRAAEALARAASAGAVLVSGDAQAAMASGLEVQGVAQLPGAGRVMPRRGQARSVSTLFPAHSHMLVGRDDPLKEAMARLERAADGAGGAISVLGGPGEGKTRLVQEIAERAVARGFATHVFQGQVTKRRSTLAPVIDFMEREGAFEDLSEPAGLEVWLKQICAELLPGAAYFRALYGARDAGGVAAETGCKVGAEELPAHVTRAALDWFAGLVRLASVQRPVLLICEDVHWYDVTTLEALTRAIEGLDGAHCCVLLTSRMAQAPALVRHAQMHQIELSALGMQTADQLLCGLLGEVTMPEQARAVVLGRAEGNPLIIEEFARAIILRAGPSGAAGRPDQVGEVGQELAPSVPADAVIAAPERLLPLLLARIDSVPGAIQVLQHAAVLGPRFSVSVLARLMHPIVPRAPLFEELEAAGIVFAARRGSDASYIFKHALVGEAIYSTIPLRRRGEMHARAARALIAQSRVQEGEVAGHFRLAGAHGEAARYYELAGDRAVRVAAHAEAIGAYGEALEMARHLPQSEDLMRRELMLNRKIAAQHIGLRGVPTAQAQAFFERAHVLSEDLADVEEMVNAAWGLWSIHLMVAEMDACLRTVDGLRRGLGNQVSAAGRLILEYMAGVSHAYCGTLDEAVHHLRRVEELSTPEMVDDLRMRFGMDIGLTASSFLGWVYALQGDADAADAASGRALDLARHHKSGLSQVFADVFSATKCLFLGQNEAARRHAQAALRGAEEKQFAQWIAQAKMQLARTADLAGAPGALRDLQAARAEYLASGLVLARPYCEVWIAEAQIRRGQPAEALQTLDELKRFTDATGERYYEGAAMQARVLAQDALGLGRVRATL